MFPLLSLVCFEELLAQDGIALPDADHIAAKEADVLGLVPLCDQLEKVEFGADPAASGTNGLLSCDPNGGQVGKGGDVLRNSDRVKDGWEESAVGAEP